MYAERSALLDQVDAITSGSRRGGPRFFICGARRNRSYHSRIEHELDPQVERIERLERTRQEHNRNANVNVARGAGPVDSRSLVIGRVVWDEINDAARSETSFRRSLADARTLDNVEQVAAPGAVRGRLATYGIVSEGTSPQAAFVALRPVAPAAPVRGRRS